MKKKKLLILLLLLLLFNSCAINKDNFKNDLNKTDEYEKHLNMIFYIHQSKNIK